jgi:hypothetical protein
MNRSIGRGRAAGRCAGLDWLLALTRAVRAVCSGGRLLALSSYSPNLAMRAGVANEINAIMMLTTANCAGAFTGGDDG